MTLSELDSYEDRVCEVQRLVDQHIPAANKKMLELLLGHLENVALKSDKNMMTISNLGKDSSAIFFAFSHRFSITLGLGGISLRDSHNLYLRRGTGSFNHL